MDMFEKAMEENIDENPVWGFNIILERAKDDNFTCKIIKGNKKIYLYSKYYPRKNLIDRKIYNTDYIVLGLGLGYEISEILEKTKGTVYVIDYDKSFYNVIKEETELSSILSDSRVKFLFGDEYKKFDFGVNSNFYILEKAVSLNFEFFKAAIDFCKINNIIKYNKKVVCFKHITIANDCMDAFSNLGFDVSALDLYDFKSTSVLEKCLSDMGADILFSVNYNPYISHVSKALNIYYISLTVDTPCYPLYYEKPDNDKEYIFVFERSVANYLRERGLKNVFHMPVAVNTTRIKKNIQKNNFIADVSFVGGLTVSEIRKDLLSELSEETVSEIKKIIEKQSKCIDKYVVKELVTDELSEKILKESGLEIIDRDLIVHIPLKEIMAFLIDREQIYIERSSFAKEFEKHFDFKVYGNDEWKKYVNCYEGFAEHFKQMPDVFNRSKINLNIIRTCFESGLPMRVFDILGSCGFLLSNYKEELVEYFDDGVDIAVFHSMEEAIELAEYYLKRDELRYKMIESAYNKVKKFHTYEDRIKEMLKIVFG